MRAGRLRDDVTDVLIELSARRGRALLLLVGVALSTGVLVAAYTLSAAAARQVDAGLAAAGSSVMTVGVREAPADADVAVAAGPVFPDDTEERVGRLGLVLAAGRGVEVSADDARPRRLQGGPAAEVSVLGATSGYLRADLARVGQAPVWMLDGQDARRVALVGTAAADRLGVGRSGPPAPGVAVWVGGERFDVVGVISSSAGGALANTVVVPYARALEVGGVSDAQARVLVRTELGGGSPVAAVVRSAILPQEPAALVTSSVADFTGLREGVGSQLGALVAAVGALLLAVSTLLVANAMVVSVVARTSEIGLRRSLGASSVDVARVFLLEGGLVGLLGGLFGTGAGMACSVVVAAVNGWDAQQPVLAALVGPLVGLVAGVVASAYPAWRAGAVAPAEAMRAD